MAKPEKQTREELQADNEQLRENLTVLEHNRAQLSRDSERLTMMNRVSHELNSLDLKQIAHVAVEKIPRILTARFCSLYLYDYQNDELVLHARNHPGELRERIPIRERPDSVMGTAYATRKPVHIISMEEYEKATGKKLDQAHSENYRSGSCISIPLLAGKYVVGVLNLADKEDNSVFDAMNDLPIVEQIGQVLALAIRNCHLFAEMQDQARTDGMTGLLNYRCFHEMLQNEIHRSSRYARPLGLIMLDVDHFKKINDTLGHPGGDTILIELSKRIRRALRQEDLPARYGGDEVAVILPETKPIGVLAVSHRLFAVLREEEFVYEGKKVKVQVSMGAASYEPKQTLTEFIAAADKALYKAKEAGKNRVETTIRLKP